MISIPSASPNHQNKYDLHQENEGRRRLTGRIICTFIHK